LKIEVELDKIPSFLYNKSTIEDRILSDSSFGKSFLFKNMDMEITKYTFIGDWREAAKVEGYFVPFQLCTGLAIAMKKHSLSFVEAFEFLAKHNKIFLAGQEFSYDLSGDQL